MDVNNSLNQHKYSVEVEECLKRNVREDEKGKQVEVKPELEARMLKEFQMETSRVELGLRGAWVGVVRRGEDGGG